MLTHPVPVPMVNPFTWSEEIDAWRPVRLRTFNEEAPELSEKKAVPIAVEKEDIPVDALKRRRFA